MSIIQNIENRILKFKFNKIIFLLFIMFFFSIIYMLLDDNHFEGVNKFKEIVKEEVIKDKVQEKIKETFDILDNFYSKNQILNKQTENSEQEEAVIEEATKETEKQTENEELDIESVEPTLINKYFNRLYFAIITGCLLGYGDIYPISNVSKLLASCQSLLTIILIIY